MDAPFTTPDEVNQLTPDLFYDLGWTPLRVEAPADSALPPVGVPVAVAARDFGVALIDFAPHRVDGATGRLRRRLDAVSFEADFPGFLPVAHVTLDEADRWRLSSVLDHAFAQIDPIGIAAGDWIARVQDALGTAAPAPGPAEPDPTWPHPAGLDPAVLEPVGPDPVEPGRVAAGRPAVAVPTPSVAAVLAPPVPTEPLLLRVPPTPRRRRLRGVLAFWGLLLLVGGLGAAALHSYGPPSSPTAEVPVAQVPASQAQTAQAPAPQVSGAQAPGAPRSGAQGSGTRSLGTQPGSSAAGTQVAGTQPPGASPSRTGAPGAEARAPAVARGASGVSPLGAESRAAEAPGTGGASLPFRLPAASVPTEAGARGMTPPGDTGWVNPDAPGAPAPTGPPRAGPQGEEAGPDEPRIVIHHAAGDAGNAQRLARAVGGSAAPEMRSVPATPTTPAVRYFHPGDRRAAEELVSRLGKGWRVHDFTSFSPRPSRSTLEVWMPEGRGAPRGAAAVRGGTDRGGADRPREALGGIY